MTRVTRFAVEHEARVLLAHPPPVDVASGLPACLRAAGASVEALVDVRQRASYLDTAGGTLARAGAELKRVDGDRGRWWILKERLGTTGVLCHALEVGVYERRPDGPARGPGGPGGGVPRGGPPAPMLAWLVQRVAADPAALGCRMRLEQERVKHRVAAGGVRLEVGYDAVTATAPGRAEATAASRFAVVEVEVEAGVPDTATCQVVEEMVRALCRWSGGAVTSCTKLELARHAGAKVVTDVQEPGQEVP